MRNIAYHLDCPSDHLPLLTTVLWKEREESLPRLKPETFNIELFHCLFFISVKSILPLPSPPKAHDLDILADGITNAVHNAYSGAAQRSLSHGKGNPWWDQSCQLAREEYKSSIRA